LEGLPRFLTLCVVSCTLVIARFIPCLCQLLKVDSNRVEIGCPDELRRDEKSFHSEEQLEKDLLLRVVTEQTQYRIDDFNDSCKDLVDKRSEILRAVEHFSVRVRVDPGDTMRTD
jgi:hypothetical protein